MSIYERFCKLCEERCVTVLQLSRGTGISRNTINSWHHRKAMEALRSETIDKLVNFFGVDKAYLLRGDESQKVNDDYVFIPEYEFAFGCGVQGEPTLEELQECVPFPYLKSYFRNLRVDPNDCKLVKVKGDSMSPVIEHNDKVLIQCVNVQSIINGAIYALVLRSGLSVKKLYKDDFKHTLTIHSCNERESDIVLSEEQVKEEVIYIYKVLRIERDLVF